MDIRNHAKLEQGSSLVHHQNKYCLFMRDKRQMGEDMGQMAIRIILGLFIEIKIIFPVIWIANMIVAPLTTVIIRYSTRACKFHSVFTTEGFVIKRVRAKSWICELIIIHKAWLSEMTKVQDFYLTH